MNKNENDPCEISLTTLRDNSRRTTVKQGLSIKLSEEGGKSSIPSNLSLYTVSKIAV